MTSLPKPIAMTKDTVVLSRAAWKKIGEALEEAEDRAAVRASKSRERRGNDEALPVAFYRRIRAGEHPIRVWRDYRGVGLNKLALQAGIARGYLSEIENGKKAGSMSALKRVAEALNIGLDDAAPANPALRTEIAARAARADIPKARAKRAGKGRPPIKADELPATGRRKQ